MLLLLAGQATMLGTVGAMLPWPAFWLWLHWRFIGSEERVMLDTFGDKGTVDLVAKLRLQYAYGL